MTAHDVAREEMRAAFLKAIADQPGEPSHKLAYADWLREAGHAQTAYAYEWAARRGFHPKQSAQRRFFTWGAVGRYTARPQPHMLPMLVHNAVRPKFRRGKSLDVVFVALGFALEKLRQLVALDGKE